MVSLAVWVYQTGGFIGCTSLLYLPVSSQPRTERRRWSFCHAPRWRPIALLFVQWHDKEGELREGIDGGAG